MIFRYLPIVKVFGLSFAQWVDQTHLVYHVFAGFAISGKRILTCAHVVGVLNQCTFIDVQRNNSTTIYKARVTKITHECDLAILEVDNDDFWEGMSALSPPLGEALSVVGFPEGTIGFIYENIKVYMSYKFLLMHWFL